MRREDVFFDSAGSSCAAWFYRPDDTGHPLPCVVLAHGFGAVRAQGLDAYARRFAEAGIAALVFDYRGFGDSEGHPRQVLDVRAQLWDWIAAVRHVRGLPSVDPDRVALWGSSFSGGHVVALAARDHRIAAVISQVPYLGLVRKRLLPQPRVLALAGKSIVDSVLARLRPGRPLLIPTIGDPGSAAMLQASGAEEQFRSLLTDGRTWENTVAARIVLQLPGYRPGEVAGRIRCPVLYCACTGDPITPMEPIVRAAEDSPLGQLRTYQGEHFEIYRGPAFDEAVTDQTKFLLEHLRG